MAYEYEFIASALASFIALFAIMDPFVSLPAFLSFTHKEKPTVKEKVAREAITIAGALLFVFLFLGRPILDVLGISIHAMQIAGALILGLLGLELILGISFKTEKVKKSEMPPYAVLLGTPLITGPGVITTTILLVDKFGMAPVFLAAILSLVLIWLVFKQANLIERALGVNGLKIFSRVMGLIIVAIAVQFAISGIKAAFGL